MTNEGSRVRRTRARKEAVSAERSLPGSWLFLLIAGVAIWTDIEHLIQESAFWPALPFMASILSLVVSLITAALRKTTIANGAFLTGAALTLVGTILR